MLHAGPRGCSEELAGQRMKEQVAHRIPGDERVLPPRPSYFKFQAGAKIARAEVLISKRTGFMDRAAADRKPVEERRGVQIQILPEEVLVHLHRRPSVAP